MPILKRDDGVQFAIHTYRELLSAKRPTLFKSEVRMLAKNHGEYVQLFKQNQHQYEAVFSREPGFLLGETVWQHFNKPEDLVYCEALPEGQQAIVVVVRSASVYLDTKIPFASIMDEFAPLLTGTHQYAIYVYGDVPVSGTEATGKFVFDKNFVKSFTPLTEPILQKLPIDPAFQLQPLELALRSLRLRRTSPMTVTLLVIVLLALVGWWYLQQREEVVAPQVAKPAPKLTPFLAYYQALTTPAPEKQLAEMIVLVSQLYGMPGWSAKNVTFNGSNYQIKVQSQGGTIRGLQQWANSKKLQFRLTQQGPELSVASQLSNRPKPTTIAESQATITFIMDRMDQLLAAKSVSLGRTSTLGRTKDTRLTIRFSNISPAVLNLVGRELSGLPVKLNSVKLSIAQGLLSGTIELNVLGK